METDDSEELCLVRSFKFPVAVCPPVSSAADQTLEAASTDSISVTLFIYFSS